jgi:hypothetical protein
MTVIINEEGYYFGRIGKLINVVDTQFYTFKRKKIAHVLIDGTPVVFPLENIIILPKEEI